MYTPFTGHAASSSIADLTGAGMALVPQISPLAMPGQGMSRQNSLESYASYATNASAATEARRRRLRRVPSYSHSISTVMSIVSGTTSIFLPPKPQSTEYEQHISAQPSFDLRKLPPSNYFFQALNVVMIAALLAAAVVDYYYKTGRIE